jgi:hypothetical protein
VSSGLTNVPNAIAAFARNRINIARLRADLAHGGVELALQ